MTRPTGSDLRVTVFTEDRVRDFLSRLDELVADGLVILDESEVIRYVDREKKA